MKKIIPLLLGKYLNSLAYVAPETAAYHGFRLFCYPFRPAIKPYHKDFLHKAVHTTLDVEGVAIQVYKWGTGDKKVLLLHGWQSHSYRWKNYVQRFPAEDYTLYSIDAPGHGLSGGNFLTVPFYARAIEQVLSNIGDVNAIISHSLGAFTTLYLLHHMDNAAVKKIVLLAPPGEATQFINFYRNTLRLSEKSVNLVLAHFTKIIEQPIDYFSATRFAVSLRQEALIIHDEDDEDTPHHHSLAIHRSMERSELMITKGLGHNLRSNDIIEKVYSFVETVPKNSMMEIMHTSH